jgi:hypothetical protein
VVLLRAAHEAATGDAGEAHESRAEHKHARRLGDVDVGITVVVALATTLTPATNKTDTKRTNNGRGFILV